MSIIPPPLFRRSSSTWSILRSLDTLSPSPSWTNLDHLPACCPVGSIPLILHTNAGDLQNLVNSIYSDVEQLEDDSGRTDSLVSLNKGVLESPPQPMALPPVVDLVQKVPSNVPSTPDSSPEKPRRMVHKGSVHAASEDSPTSNFWSSDTQRTSLDSSPPSPGIGKPLGLQGPSRHRRSGSASTTDSGRSSRSNPPLDAHDTNHIFPENADISVVRFPLLPVSLSWLQSTTLEVMIDQEGFRMIKPIFKLAGYAPPPSGMGREVVSLGQHLVSATADFMPLQRKSFAFHHSQLDTPPVLRRLMLNGDGSRDYLSKQAYLILKANGPYTVQGTEPVQASRFFSATEHSVLSWRFDYLVGDRKTETGKVIPGEKVLTPLSFSCSPALLLPTQGKKIRVMHVVKKSVAAKLMAMKIEPPRPPSPYPVPGATPSSDAESELQGAVTGKHRASRSNAPQDTSTPSTSTNESAQLPSPVFPHGTTEAFPPLSQSLRSPKIHVGSTSRAIVSPEIINALFPVDTLHVIDE